MSRGHTLSAGGRQEPRASRRIIRIVKRQLCTLLVIGVALGAASPVGAGTTMPRDRKVRATRHGETQAVAGDGYFAWTQRSHGRPGHANVYVKGPSGKVRKVNPRGTEAALGGISKGVLIYQQYREANAYYSRRGRSDIKLYNLKTNKRHDAPAKVNSRDWEYLPSMSGKWILFGRWNGRGRRRILAYNKQTRKIRVLDRAGNHEYIQPGQVNRGWVVWVRGGLRPYGDGYYEPSITRIDLNDDDGFLETRYLRFPWAPSITSKGIAYFGRTGPTCGSKPRIIRWTHYGYGSPVDVVIRLKRGFDLAHSYVSENDNKVPRVLHEVTNCRRSRASSDIYGFIDGIRLDVATAGTGLGTVTSRPAGIDCGYETNDCTAVFPAGITVLLEPYAAPGSRFHGWRGNTCSPTPDFETCGAYTNKPKQMTARFDLGPDLE